MIVLLFNCLLSLVWANESDIPFTGKIQETDTTVVTVPIAIIKEANIKLHERIILKDIVMNLEDKVVYYQKLTDNQTKEINQLRTDLFKMENSRDDAVDKANTFRIIAYSEAIALVLLGLIYICN